MARSNSESESTGTKRLRRAKDTFERSDMNNEDYEAIRSFIRADEGKHTENTVANHLQHIRRLAERTDTPLTELSEKGANDLLQQHQSGSHPDVKDSGVVTTNYITALRAFYKFHRDLDVNSRNIGIDEVTGERMDKDYSGRDLTAEDMLYKDEVDDLLAAAARASIRDEALIALMLATGQRIDAIRTLRLGNIRVDGPAMEVELNTEEGDTKGASGSKPILWAKDYVRPWYENHPYEGNPDAALFPARHPEGGDKSAIDFTTEPLSDDRLRTMIKKRAEEAGIDKDVYPHLFRHSAITRMAAQEGLNEQSIKNIVGWSEDSSQFGTYAHLSDELATDGFREALGYPTSESGPPIVGRPSLEECPNCGDRLQEGSERCSTCQTPLTHEEAEKGEPIPPDPSDVAEHFSDPADAMELMEELKEQMETQMQSDDSS